MKTGDEYFDSQEFCNLLAEYEKAVSTGQPVFMDADELAEIADYYQMSEQPDEAEAAIQLALSLAPGAVAPLTYRIHEALSQGDTKKAWQLLGQIIDKDEPDYIYDRGEILIVEGNTEEADKYFREVFKTVPADEYQDFVMDVANIFADYGLNDKAMEWMERAKYEDTPDFKETMARVLVGLGKYKDSERIFNELIDRHPFSKHYWNALASAQFMNQDYSGSVSSSEYAIAIDPHDPDGLLTKANGLFQLENYDEALKYYQRYVQEVPEDEPAMSHIYMELAFCYSHDHQIDKALEMLDKAGRDDINKMVAKGHMLLENDLIEKALDAFQSAFTLSDGDSSVLMSIAVSLYDNRYIKACYAMFGKYFQYVKAIDSDTPNGYAYMALCCYDLGRKEEFLQYLKEAVKRNPDEARLVLGFLFPDDMEPDDYYEYIYPQMKQ